LSQQSKELTMMNRLATASALAAVSLLAACGNMGTSPASGMKPMFTPITIPAAVQVPAGNTVAMETTGVGEITYMCSAKKDIAGQFEWVFVGPDAQLKDRSGKTVGKYYGPPATWESMDGSKLTATQVAVAPNGADNIPYQLVKANPAMGSGMMNGVTYIQRTDTKGGIAPDAPCTANTVGSKRVVKYSADYIFYKAA
jgi:Protein of unknown function (DUF3455)